MFFIVDLNKYFNHKNVFKNNLFETANNIGINGFCVTDKLFQGTRKNLIISNIDFNINGSETKLDNIICYSQVIDIESPFIPSKIALLGFSEFNSSIDKLIIKAGKRKIIKQFGFYNTFSIDFDTSVYNSLLGENIIGELKLKTNQMGKMNYYVFLIKDIGIKEKEFSVELPNNFDIHICAITLI